MRVKMNTVALYQLPVTGHYLPMPTSELWQRLRQARKFADLTQQDLADACSVTRGAVGQWEAAEIEHRTKPTTEHLITVARVTRVPLEWLLNDTSDLNALWRLNGEFGASRAADGARPAANDSSDVLPDLPQGEQLFVFAQTPEQIARKFAQLAALPSGVKGHLILVGCSAQVHTAATPADALSAVVQVLLNNR